MLKNFKTVTVFFSGAGGLDLGFKMAGFNVIFANEFDKNIWETYEKNHLNTKLNKESITNLKTKDIPTSDGVIGSPPCQSWCFSGTQKGIKDKRGQLFYDFINIIKHKKPEFFMVENVAGMLAKKHKQSLSDIKKAFMDVGYDLYFKLLNASDYGTPQDRKRVIFIGFRKDLNIKYNFPLPNKTKITLKDSIFDLKDSAVPAIKKTHPNPLCSFPNHEYDTQTFSSMYMSRNRVRTWNDQSFTIQASGRHAPIHPSARKMIKISRDEFKFNDSEKDRRLSVRECARIQGFPDDFLFYYKNTTFGYKMVGNAVPVNFAYLIALSIRRAFEQRAE